MKFFLLLAVLALGLWLWRSGRSVHSGSSKPDVSAAPQAQTMVACALCQVHVPQAEAFAGKRGHYCSAQHRQQAEP
jgi:uncharacterized protein